METVLAVLVALAFQEDRTADLLRRLENGSPEAREQATKGLRALGEEAVPGLRNALRHGDAEVRARAAAILRRIEWDDALDPRLLSRYPELREPFELGRHAEVLNFCRSHPSFGHGFGEGFEAYAVRLLDLGDPDQRRDATQFLHHLAGFPERS